MLHYATLQFRRNSREDQANQIPGLGRGEPRFATSVMALIQPASECVHSTVELTSETVRASNRLAPIHPTDPRFQI